MPELGEIISGKYRILERLGSGAMGVVYSALHLDTDKKVALKWLNQAISGFPDDQGRFKREAKATGRIHHPNVVDVHDCGEHDGQLYLVMEYLAGPTLRATLAAADDRCLPLTTALELLFPVMRGIAAAHAAGVLHRDLKPENVLLSESPDGLAPIPKVLDFGLAKVRSEAESFAAKLSMPGSLLGTYQYMAPEQLRPQIEVDERIDVYALGAILYEMLSGRPPYQADNPIDLVLQIHAGEVAPLDVVVRNVPRELSAVLACALARDREQRIGSVHALAIALEPFTDLSFRGSRGVPTELPSGDAATPGERTVSATPGVPATRSPALQECWLRAALGLLGLFAQPTSELAVANDSIRQVQLAQSQPSAANRGSGSAPAGSAAADPEAMEAAIPILSADPPSAPQPSPDPASNEDWHHESRTVSESPQPKAAVPFSASSKVPPRAAPRAVDSLPARRDGVDSHLPPPRVPTPGASSSPRHTDRRGPGTLSTDEF